MGKLLTLLGVKDQSNLPPEIFTAEDLIVSMQYIYENSPESPKKETLAKTISEVIRLTLQQIKGLPLTPPPPPKVEVDTEIVLEVGDMLVTNDGVGLHQTIFLPGNSQTILRLLPSDKNNPYDTIDTIDENGVVGNYVQSSVIEELKKGTLILIKAKDIKPNTQTEEDVFILTEEQFRMVYGTAWRSIKNPKDGGTQMIEDAEKLGKDEVPWADTTKMDYLFGNKLAEWAVKELKGVTGAVNVTQDWRIGIMMTTLNPYFFKVGDVFISPNDKVTYEITNIDSTDNYPNVMVRYKLSSTQKTEDLRETSLTIVANIRNGSWVKEQPTQQTTPKKESKSGVRILTEQEFVDIYKYDENDNYISTNVWEDIIADEADNDGAEAVSWVVDTMNYLFGQPIDEDYKIAELKTPQGATDFDSWRISRYMTTLNPKYVPATPSQLYKVGDKFIGGAENQTFIIIEITAKSVVYKIVSKDKELKGVSRLRKDFETYLSSGSWKLIKEPYKVGDLFITGSGDVWKIVKLDDVQFYYEREDGTNAQYVARKAANAWFEDGSWELFNAQEKPQYQVGDVFEDVRGTLREITSIVGDKIHSIEADGTTWESLVVDFERKVNNGLFVMQPTKRVAFYKGMLVDAINDWEEINSINGFDGLTEEERKADPTTETYGEFMAGNRFVVVDLMNYGFNFWTYSVRRLEDTSNVHPLTEIQSSTFEKTKTQVVFKLNDWVITGYGMVGRINDANGDNKYDGLQADGETNAFIEIPGALLRLATREEIQKALIDEANKKFTDDVVVKPVRKLHPKNDYYVGSDGRTYNPSESDNKEEYKFSSIANDTTYCYYNQDTDTLFNWGRGLGILYSKGVWATQDSEKNGEEKYEVGDWVWFEGTMVYISKINSDGTFEGITAENAKFKEVELSYITRRATPEEISKAIIENKKREEKGGIQLTEEQFDLLAELNTSDFTSDGNGISGWLQDEFNGYSIKKIQQIAKELDKIGVLSAYMDKVNEEKVMWASVSGEYQVEDNNAYGYYRLVNLRYNGKPIEDYYQSDKTINKKIKLPTKKEPTKKGERQSPTTSANDVKEGTKKKGNDGNMWVAKKTKAGYNQWKKV